MAALKKCLVVEDVPMIRRIIEMMMGRLHCEVIAASDGAMALAACQVSMPDIIVVDWSMPKMDGLTFIAELKKLENGHRPKIIMCTVNKDRHHISMALSAGVDEYISKPFTINALVEKLEKLDLLTNAPTS